MFLCRLAVLVWLTIALVCPAAAVQDLSATAADAGVILRTARSVEPVQHREPALILEDTETDPAPAQKKPGLDQPLLRRTVPPPAVGATWVPAIPILLLIQRQNE